MAGTKTGGIAARNTNKQLYGEDFYYKIGSIGGRNSKTGGFYANRDLAIKAGRIGGMISRRGQKLSNTECRAIVKKLQRSDYISEQQQMDRERMSRLARKYA